MAGLVLAALGVTAPGRDLLRSLIAAWPGFAVLRDAQQFVAPLALAEAVGFGLAVAAALNPVPAVARNRAPGPRRHTRDRARRLMNLCARPAPPRPCSASLSPMLSVHADAPTTTYRRL